MNHPTTDTRRPLASIQQPQDPTAQCGSRAAAHSRLSFDTLVRAALRHRFAGRGLLFEVGADYRVVGGAVTSMTLIENVQMDETRELGHEAGLLILSYGAEELLSAEQRDGPW
jgi:hypothetical protein